jgi:hypothetical protein
MLFIMKFESAEEAVTILRINTESRFYVQLTTKKGDASLMTIQDTASMSHLKWLLAETFEGEREPSF